jgi:hypothetical protein
MQHLPSGEWRSRQAFSRDKLTQADDQRTERLMISAGVFAIENAYLDHVGRLQGKISNGFGPHFPQVENSILRPRVDPNRMRPWLVTIGRLCADYKKL